MTTRDAAAILSPDSQLARRGVVGPPGPMEDQGSTQFNLSMSQLHTFLNLRTASSSSASRRSISC